ncbi:MAG: chitobiase/beta-hexosaminidase C-terminal domain-containing protein [Candidatus Syntrophosphaera sp.]|nr:chitobiase/beta-hexosaminidase C-terminal domain-containing protein [Candidatus Syntrophosphaera sp.]
MKFLNLALLLGLMAPALFARPLEPGRQPGMTGLPQGKPPSEVREPPQYTFSKLPTSLITNYYDYMIGSYHSLPLRVIPNSAGGGYFMTYHGRRQATSYRRAFYAYLDPIGNIVNNSEIMTGYNLEGYPTLAVDPISGKPLYAWQANTDGDAELEVRFCSDAFIASIAGLFNDPVTVVNNPTTITSPDGTTTTSNEFIWPSAVIGPSPIAGKRRIYVLSKNAVSSTFGPSENPYIAYADFNGDDIEMGMPLVWNHTSIPEMNQWNVDLEWRSPFAALAADGAGNLYYAGYHTAFAANGSVEISEPDMDVFKCGNFGQGTWARVSSFSNLPTWNPPESPSSTLGYFKNPGGIPYTDDQIYWSIYNSTHSNAVTDNYGKIHFPAIWALRASDGTHFSELQFVKEFVFDPLANIFEVREIHPRKEPADDFNDWFTPWDMQAPWGEVDQYNYDPAETPPYWPAMATGWPYPHWDESGHNGDLLSLYSNLKISEANTQDMMVCVWQNSRRARLFNHFGDADYSAYANTPEICISVSSDNGSTWSEPIILNNVETPQFAGLKPMWVYPADKVIYTGMQGNQKVGKIGVMFYNDFTWGANAIDPPYHPTPNGGQVMFMELEIVFPVGGVVQVASPSLAPPPGTYIGPQNVVISCATPNAQIRYTLDGSDPSETSALYGAPIHIATTTTLRARAYYPSFIPSNISGGEYIITYQVEIPVFDPPGGIHTEPVAVSISCPTPEAVIRFTLDGSEPDASSEIYTTSLFIVETTTIKAKAYYPGWVPSQTATAVYTITGTVAAPGFSPPAGSYDAAQLVTLACSTPQAQIRYTLDGSDPDATSQLYSDPISVETTLSIKARAFRTDWAPSPIAEAYYNIAGMVATPLFDPPGGYFYPTLDVSISSATPGAEIRFTLDETDPDQTSALYTAPIHLEQTTTIKARAYSDGLTPSPIAVAVYTWGVSNPDEPVPVVTGIRGIHPNPFTTVATISLALESPARNYRLRIYNLKGECLFSQEGSAKGLFEVAWNGTDPNNRRVSAGLYLVTFQAGKHHSTAKMVMF